MTNPYVATSPVAKHPDEWRNAGPTSLVAASTSGAFVALAVGMTTCWIRGGWLNQQLQVPIENWRLPAYFVFHCGIWCASSLALTILALPIYLYLRRFYNVWQLMCFVYVISATATFAFEICKGNFELSYP